MLDLVKPSPASPPLIDVRHVSQTFRKSSGEAGTAVLDDVNIALNAGEIVGLLGRSGSGKSSLLRIVAGLVRPSAGEVVYAGAPLTGPADGIAMVFQSFALFPWLTVQANVELGLKALRVPADEARRRYGVQFHPEETAAHDAASQRLFNRFVQAL